MLYLTSQRTKLSDVWCFEILELNKDYCKNNGAKRASGWRDMQIYAPWRAPIKGTGT
jgi:hypothetical protein